jgi:hypothetical protein
MNDEPNWYDGGCHCGRVRFRVRLGSDHAMACNCSICDKKGFINVIVEAGDFELLRGDEFLSSYRFNTETAEHRFCRVCGIHPFSRPRSHPGAYDVNARCLDRGYDWLTITPFDGQNWEASVDAIR